MSVIRCHKCERSVDTDFEETEVLEHKYSDVELCQGCAQEIYDWEDAQNDKAAKMEELAERMSNNGLT